MFVLFGYFFHLTSNMSGAGISKRQLYSSNSIRAQVSVSKKAKATKTIFTELCHHLYLLLAHTDKDQRKFKKSIFT